MLNKIRDWFDTKCSMLILVDEEDDLLVVAEVFVSTGLNRLQYEVYKNDIAPYMIEIRMPYNRYLAMMRELHKKGYNLRPESKTDIINRLIKDRA